MKTGFDIAKKSIHDAFSSFRSDYISAGCTQGDLIYGENDSGQKWLVLSRFGGQRLLVDLCMADENGVAYVCWQERHKLYGWRTIRNDIVPYHHGEKLQNIDAQSYLLNEIRRSLQEFKKMMVGRRVRYHRDMDDSVHSPCSL